MRKTYPVFTNWRASRTHVSHPGKSNANRDDSPRSPGGQVSTVRVATMARRYVQVSRLHRPDGVDGTLVAGFPGGCGHGIKRGCRHRPAPRRGRWSRAGRVSQDVIERDQPRYSLTHRHDLTHVTMRRDGRARGAGAPRMRSVNARWRSDGVGVRSLIQTVFRHCTRESEGKGGVRCSR